MPLFERSVNEIISDTIVELNTSTQLNRLSPGSKTRALVETFSRSMNRAYKIFDLNLARAFLSGSTGKYIDFLGELLGVSRLGIETATVSETAETIKFYVDTGTFGDINSSAQIILPVGTLISSEPESTGVIYRLTQGAILSTGSTSKFVAAEATSPGEVANVGSNILVFHNFTNYTDSANNTLKVKNIAPVLNGANIESDTNYKYRISRATLAGQTGNQTAILLATLSTPGVANAVLDTRSKGIGTFSVFIKSITATVSDDLITNVERNIELVLSEGAKGFITRPEETGVSITLSITYTNGLGDDVKSQIDDQIKLTVTEYVNNLDLGDELILNQIVDRVLSVSPSIKDIGIPNKPIDEIFLYKETNLQDNKIRVELLTNYEASSTERIIIEPSLPVPITIIRQN